MKIRTRLRINSAIALVMILVMVVFFVQFSQQTLQTDQNLTVAEEMGKTAFERTLLRDEYLAHQSERAKLQWEAKTERFRHLLEKAEREFPKPSDKKIIEEIEKAFGETIPIFYKLVEVGAQEKYSQKESDLFYEGQKRLVSQILLKVHVLMDRIGSLRASVKRATDTAHKRLHLLFIIFVAVIVLITIGNTIVINNLLSKRIGALLKGTEFIGEGHLDYCIDVPGNDELSDLARKSNEMAVKLKESHTSVGNLQREIMARKQTEEEVQRLNSELEQRVVDRTAQLEAANRELEAFSYSVSHDLRGPLRAIDGFSRILLEDYGERLDAEGKRLFNVIRTNTQNMDQLITDLLALSRVSKSELKFSRVGMTGMARSIYHEVTTPEIQQKFVLNIASLPDSAGDPALLRQVWSNLLSNAVKFTLPRKERRIDITGHTEGGMNIYSIRDTGVGFNPLYTHKLFGVFQRLHKSTEFEGNGVGLAIVQRIIHRHGGRVWAEGKVKEGAIFSFSLPCQEAYHE